MKATDLDKKFDAGEDITKHLDLSKARHPRARTKACQYSPACLDDCWVRYGSKAIERFQTILDQDANRASS